MDNFFLRKLQRLKAQAFVNIRIYRSSCQDAPATMSNTDCFYSLHTKRILCFFSVSRLESKQTTLCLLCLEYTKNIYCICITNILFIAQGSWAVTFCRQNITYQFNSVIYQKSIILNFPFPFLWSSYSLKQSTI